MKGGFNGILWELGLRLLGVRWFWVRAVEYEKARITSGLFFITWSRVFDNMEF